MSAFFGRQLTVGGLAFTLVVLAVAVTAVVSTNNLLFLILAVMLATLMVSNFVSRLALAGLELDFQLPEHVSARRKFPARVYIRNMKRWTPSFSVRVSGAGGSVFASPLYIPVLPGGGTVEEIVDVRFEQRGLHREDNFQFSTSFPFGFLERRAQVRLRREVLVYPCLDPQPGFEALLTSVSGEIATHHRGQSHDFYRIRPYESFESARNVDWKATAHTGSLQVREFAREQEPLVEIFFDLEVPEHLSEWFEQAIECCAFITWHLAQKSARIRFRSQQFYVAVPESGDIYTILKYLAVVSPATGKLPTGPDEPKSFQIVFSAAPDRIAQSGWTQARFVSPDTFGVFARRSASTDRAGQDLDHGGREDRR